MTMEKVEKRLAHVVDGLAFVDDRRSWADRVKEWGRPMTFDQRMEWLHVNSQREDNGPEKAIFFMKLADRYGERDLFPSSKDGSDEILLSRTENVSTIPQMRRRIVQRAFSVLVNTFFRQTEEHCGFPYVLPYTEPLFSELLWFFRPYGELGGFDNLRPRDTERLAKDGGDHYVRLANDFAKDFMFGAWELLNNCWNRSWDINPKGKVTHGHEREIIMLVRRLDLMDYMQGQLKPIARVFKTMFAILCEENFQTQVPSSDLEDPRFVEQTLRKSAKTGWSFARYLYVARLNVE